MGHNGRGRCRHDDGWHAGLSGNRADCHGDGGETEATEEGDLVIHNQLLREALGNIGNTLIILDDDFDALASNHVAALGHEGLGAGIELATGGSLRAGHRQDQADLDHFLSEGRNS